MPPVPPPLTADAAAQWAPRVPGWVQPAAVVASVAVCIGTSIAGEGEGGITAELVASPVWFAESVVQSAFLAAAVVVFLAPAAGASLAALTALAVAASSSMNAGLPALWAGAGAGLAVLAAADGLARTRQRALART